MIYQRFIIISSFYYLFNKAKCLDYFKLKKASLRDVKAKRLC
jgi:hypothetical protein